MRIREAQIADIPQIQWVRNSVRENTLSDPALVTDKDVEDYIINRGKGWVSEIESEITGFSIVSVVDNNVWALFVSPEYEAKGTGKKLHNEMMNWYFKQTDKTIWLSTSPGTRAEGFYRKEGWADAGLYGKGEIKFEMTAENWGNIRHTIDQVS